MTSVAATTETAGKRSFAEVYIVTIGHALTHWYPATFYVLLPVIGIELGLTYTQISSIVVAQALASAFSNVPGGILVDSIGRKGLLMAFALAWVGLPYMEMATTSTYSTMLICAVIIGIGNTLWHPTAIPTLAQRFPNRKGLAVSIHSMGGNVGDAVAPAVAGLLLSGFVLGSVLEIPAITWRQVMLYNVIPGVAMSIAILWWLGGTRSSDSGKADDKTLSLHEVLRGFVGLLRNRTLMMLSISSSFRAATQGSLLVFVPLYLANVMGYSALAVGAAMMGLQLAGFIAAPIAGSMSDKMGRRRIMMMSLAMTAVVVLAMTFAGGTPAFVFFVALLGFFLFAVRAVLQAWTLDATPRGMGGSAIGLLFGIQAVGNAVGPFICGVIADRYGIISAFYFMAATVVIANLCVFLVPDPGQAQRLSVAR